uniref:Uncharacterized protein n=1 Tax=Cacopsylla melanoneura TaxID=428564 RepID=A0A8D8VGU7_9HEMI
MFFDYFLFKRKSNNIGGPQEIMKHLKLSPSVGIRTGYESKVQTRYQLKEIVFTHWGDRSVCDNLLLFREYWNLNINFLTTVVTKTIVNSVRTVVMRMLKINEEVI